ncbi:MAG TPA: YceI family protein [Candidatus Limnocylindria bacterium]|nr:YceI family protein [Candidatus Limnocylindria bacterium]
MRKIPIALFLAFATACAPSAAAPAATATPTATVPSTAAPPSIPSASAGATWTVTSASKATVSVREQLVGVSLPSDAVLTATGAAGSFAVNADGTFTPESKITFDVSTLASDRRDRDNFIKQSTLQVRQFPAATFVPTKATGLTLPLAADADVTFALAGKLTIHGVTKDVTFDVVAKRSGAQLTATATAAPALRFEDFGMTAPSVPFRVVSVTDEIHLVVEVVATGAAS